MSIVQNRFMLRHRPLADRSRRNGHANERSVQFGGALSRWRALSRRRCGRIIYSNHDPRAAVTKSELVERLLANHPLFDERDIETIVNIVFGQIAAALARDDRVELRGFGSFSIKRREARIGRNPRTGDKVQVSDKGYPYFRTGKSILDLLN